MQSVGHSMEIVMSDMLTLRAIIIAMAFSMFSLSNGYTYIQCNGGQLWVLATHEGGGTPRLCSPLPCDRPGNCTCNSECSSGPSVCAHDLKTVYCSGREANKVLPTTLPSIVYWRVGSPCQVTITPEDEKVAELSCLYGDCKLSDASQITPCSKAVKNGTFSLVFDAQRSDVLIRIDYISATPTSSPSTISTTPSTASQTSTTTPTASPTNSTTATISNSTESLTTKPANATTATSLPNSTTSPILSSIFNIPRTSTPLPDSKIVPLDGRGNATLSPDVIAIVATLSVVIVLTAVLIGLFLKFFYQKSIENRWDQLITSPRPK